MLAGQAVGVRRGPPPSTASLESEADLRQDHWDCQGWVPTPPPRDSRVPAHDSVNDASASSERGGALGKDQPVCPSSDHILFVLGLLSMQSALPSPSPPEPPMESQGQECAAVRAHERREAGGKAQGTCIKQGEPGSHTSWIRAQRSLPALLGSRPTAR